MATWNLITRTFPLLVHRIKSGGVYPDRIEGMSNVFVGDTDPGVAMDANEDFWANPDFTTLSSVATSAATNGTALNTAIKDAVGGVWFPAADAGYLDTGVTRSVLASGELMVLWFPTGVARSIRTVINIPSGWSTMYVDIYWTHDEATHAANIRWDAVISHLELGEQIPGSGTFTQSANYVAAVNDIDDNEFTVTTVPTAMTVLPAGGPMGLRIQRTGSSGSDTFAGSVALIGVRLRKAS